MGKKKKKKKRCRTSSGNRKFDGLTIDEIYALSCKVNINHSSGAKIIKTTVKR